MAGAGSRQLAEFAHRLLENHLFQGGTRDDFGKTHRKVLVAVDESHAGAACQCLEMNEDVITYTDLKFDKSSESRRPRASDKETCKESATYQELKCHTSVEQQESQRPQGAGHKDPRPPQWLLTTVIFGLLCLLLLIATGVLAFQVIQQGRKQELLTQQLEFYQSQTKNHPGTLQELPRDGGDKCPARWTQSSNSWYLFAAAEKTWGQCKSYCSTQATWLLKTESKEEKDFIQKESYLYFDLRQDFKYFFPFWIGLSYNSSTEKWVWVDSTSLSSGLFEIPEAGSQHYRQGACAYIQGGTVRVGACGDTRFCLCEKMTDLART